jgi:hypothetical protein
MICFYLTGLCFHYFALSSHSIIIYFFNFESAGERADQQ